MLLHERPSPLIDTSYKVVAPSSTATTVPWMYPASSPARKAISSATSPGAPTRPAGVPRWKTASPSSPNGLVPSVRIGPGLTALTRTPRGPSSAAQTLVSVSIAALLDEVSPAARAADGLDGGGAPLRVPPGDDDVRAVPAQPDRGGAADPAGRAGDPSGLAGQICGHGVLPFGTATMLASVATLAP